MLTPRVTFPAHVNGICARNRITPLGLCSSCSIKECINSEKKMQLCGNHDQITFQFQIESIDK